MSWSVSMIGKAANVVKALDEESDRLTGQSKVEFDAAKPHLAGLVQQNFVTPAGVASGYIDPLIRLEASGSGSVSAGEDVSRSAKVTIEPLWTKLV